MIRSMDRNLYAQIGLDSGSLTMLGVVVHQFNKAGNFAGQILQDDVLISSFLLTVTESSPVMSLDIDLAALSGTLPAITTSTHRFCNCGQADARSDPLASQLTLHPKGYAVFQVSGGVGGLAATVSPADAGEGVGSTFDTRTLGEGDYFSALLLRPGRYAVRNTLGGATAALAMTYPRVGTEPYVPPATAVIEVGKTFKPANVELQPAQGLTFTIAAQARIVIELTEPIDRPE